MRFEGHRFEDRGELRAALLAAWPGVWVEPRDGTEEMPFSWVLRFGEVHPDWRGRVNEACCELLLHADDGVAFSALSALRSAPWDVGPAVGAFAAEHVEALAGRPSPQTKDRTALADVAELLWLSPATDAVPDDLAHDLASRTTAADGFPRSVLIAIASSSPAARDLAVEHLVDALSASADPASLTAAVLALGQPASEWVLSAVGARGKGLATRIGDIVKAQLESAAASVEATFDNPAYSERVRAKLAAARGTHTKRWQAAAVRLGIEPGAFADPRRD